MTRLVQCLIFMLIAIHIVSADTIYFKNGTSRTDVKIIKDSYAKIAYELRKRTVSVQTERVDWIEYSDSPQELIAGRGALNKGDYEGAVSLINSAAEAASLPPAAGPWFFVYSNYLLGKAYQGWADSDPQQSDLYKTAIKHYQDAASKPESRYLHESYFGIAQCYINLKEYSKASQSLSKLEADAGRNSSDYWKIQATLWQGHKSLAQKSFTSAVSKYQRAQSLASKKELTKLEREAAIAIGNCYIQDKKFSRAKSHFESLKDAAEKNDYELLAAVENGLAMSLLEEGKITSARRKALNVILDYFEAEEERPQALFIAGLCNEKATKEKNHLKRAQACYRFLTQGYPGNPWTTKALRRLQKITQQE
ncbi:tetratricopeptide repeat protein [Candidatus Uabimicrobium sp. HlEnr_7]|uniref:tetratricopeptide repeat protein n=1 Tax=Candidatus Uabimicrobium helgolandensis TaxID=3095367 RepID=UPI003557277B